MDTQQEWKGICHVIERGEGDKEARKTAIEYKEEMKRLGGWE